MTSLENRLRNRTTTILDTVFPPVCAGCARRGHWVCDDCRATVSPISDVACERCGAEWASRCVCSVLPDALAWIRSALPFDGWVRRAVHAFKYEGERARARHLGDLLSPLIADAREADVIVPVPLHPVRMRERGFNQAALLAFRLAESLGDRKVVEIGRQGSTTPQVGLEAARRRANVAGAFLVPNTTAIANRQVVVVDDVITTTATIAACAQAILDAGATDVRCVSVARAI